MNFITHLFFANIHFLLQTLGFFLDIFMSNTIWSIIQTLGVIASVIIAFLAIRSSNRSLEKQLDIEQTPYVVGKGMISFNSIPGDGFNYLANCIYLKNIGRGMAKNIVISLEKTTHGNKTILTESNQSTTIDLGAGEEAEPWLIKIDKLLEATTDDYSRVKAYIYYFDQLDNRYITELKLERTSRGFTVIFNDIVEKVKLPPRKN